MEQRQQPLQPRSVGGLLNETFSVYGSHLWQFIGLALVVEAPINALAYFLLGSIPADFAAQNPLKISPDVVLRLFGALFAWIFGSTFGYGAIAYAVGQHYVAGQIRIGRCYARVWWRIISVTMLAIILPMTVISGLALSILIVPLLLVIGLLIYWSMAVQAVVIERHTAMEALRRSFKLVQGSWWRVLGIGLAFGLVAFGLSILITVPFALVSVIPAVEDGGALRIVVGLVANVVVAAAVTPVIFISGTLLYYDLRVRKENYNLDALSQEMGSAAIT